MTKTETKNLNKSVYWHIATTIAIFLIVSFIRWDFTWITHIPNYGMDTRAAGLVVFILLHVLVEIFILDF